MYTSGQFLSKSQVAELICISLSQIDRLERAGDFPIRIPITQKRVVWLYDEVRDWQADRLNQRASASATVPKQLGDGHMADTYAFSV